ncbi:hemolysin-III related-domain-containing protein [Dipodascopsis uninucleata]
MPSESQRLLEDYEAVGEEEVPCLQRQTRPSLSVMDSFSSTRSLSSRRHSFSHSRKTSADLEYIEEIILLKMDLFLSHLEQRLSSLESYSTENLTMLDGSLLNTYQTLTAVKESCRWLGGEVIGEGWRRGEAIVNILERRCKDALTSKDSLPSKLAAGIHFLEQKLLDLEGQCFETVDLTMKKVDSRIVDGADTLAKKIEMAYVAARSRLITYEELPAPWQENPYICRGYRFCKSYKECLFSMLTLHNETCNIWTHGFGFIMMLSVALYYFPASPNFSSFTNADKIVFGVFLLAALKCLLSSIIWHTFCSIGRLDDKRRFACFDYTGISILIVCSILTTEYASFYCDHYYQLIYMSATSAFGIVGIILAWHPAFDKPQNRWLRISFFVSLALSGVLSLVHLSFTKGIINTLSFYFPITKSLLCYLAGVVFYGFLFPERCFPGFFDWIGMSHNIWHIAVLAGIYYHYTATHKLMGNAQQFSCDVRF